MTITCICTGRTIEKYVSEGMMLYSKRLHHYINFNLIEVEMGKGGGSPSGKRETENILRHVKEKDYLILLDEKGEEMNSPGFASLIRHHQNISTRNLVFAIGGAYGFPAEMYARANKLLALSRMTFPHQLIRVIFMEQLYRAMTILKGEKYHH